MRIANKMLKTIKAICSTLIAIVLLSGRFVINVVIGLCHFFYRILKSCAKFLYYIVFKIMYYTKQVLHFTYLLIFHIISTIARGIKFFALKILYVTKRIKVIGFLRATFRTVAKIIIFLCVLTLSFLKITARGFIAFFTFLIIITKGLLSFIIFCLRTTAIGIIAFFRIIGKSIMFIASRLKWVAVLLALGLYYVLSPFRLIYRKVYGALKFFVLEPIFGSMYERFLLPFILPFIIPYFMSFISSIGAIISRIYKVCSLYFHGFYTVLGMLLLPFTFLIIYLSVFQISDLSCGVITYNGKAESHTCVPGLHVKSPFKKIVVIPSLMNIETDKLSVPFKNNQELQVRGKITAFVNNPSEVYKFFGNKDILESQIHSVAQGKLYSTISKYSSAQFLRNKQEFNKRWECIVKSILSSRGITVVNSDIYYIQSKNGVIEATRNIRDTFKKTQGTYKLQKQILDSRHRRLALQYKI